MAAPTCSNDAKSVVSTDGLLWEKRSIKWIISHFDIIRLWEDLILDQKFNFEAGSRIGLQTTWQFHLDLCERGEQYPKMKWISIFLKLLKAPTNVNQVTAAFSINCKKADGSKFFKGTLAPKVFHLGGSMGFPEFIKQDTLLDDLPLIDTSLIIDLEFILYGTQQKIVDMAVYANDEFEIKAVQELIQDRDRFQTRTWSIMDPLKKIISKEQDDKDWNSPEVIVELLYAAHKYELELLVDFLDNVLGSVCTKDNAKQLRILAKELNMKKAERELLNFIRKHGESLEELLNY